MLNLKRSGVFYFSHVSIFQELGPNQSMFQLYGTFQRTSFFRSILSLSASKFQLLWLFWYQQAASYPWLGIHYLLQFSWNTAKGGFAESIPYLVGNKEEWYRLSSDISIRKLFSAFVRCFRLIPYLKDQFKSVVVTQWVIFPNKLGRLKRVSGAESEEEPIICCTAVCSIQIQRDASP